MHRPGVDQVIVVQDEQRLVAAGPVGQLVDQGSDQAPVRGGGGRAEQRRHPFTDPGARPIQRRHYVTPEPGRVVVRWIQAQPGDRMPAALYQVGQQGGLAISGRRAHQDQSLGQAVIEPLRQPRARHEPRPWPGLVQLGGQQGVTLRRRRAG